MTAPGRSAGPASPQQGDRNRRRVAAGLLILGPLICVAGGRWGAYLQVPGTPLFVTDITTALGVIGLSVPRAGARRRVHPLWVCALLPLAMVLIIGLSRPGPPNLLVRDLAPFLYFALVPWFLAAVRHLGRDAVVDRLWIAAALHSGWYVLVTVHLLPRISIPALSTLPVFTTRNDIDELLSGLALALALVLRSRSIGARVGVGIASVVCIVGQGSRGGLIGAGVMIACVLLISRPWSRGASRPWVVGAAAAAGAAGLVALTMSDLPPWARSIVRLVPSGSSAYASADNTAEARQIAWMDIVDYLDVSGQRMFGAGFGNSVIKDSGALQHLSGDPSVRYAHSFLFSWQGEVGLVGTALICAYLGGLLIAGTVRALRSPAGSAGVGLMAGLITTGLVGVILESPFGYEIFVLAFAVAFAGEQPAHRPPFGLEDRLPAEAPADRRIVSETSGVAR